MECDFIIALARQLKGELAQTKVDLVIANTRNQEEIEADRAMTRALTIAETEKHLREARERLAEQLSYVLPMAKGFANEHDVGNNKRIIAEAEAVLAREEER